MSVGNQDNTVLLGAYLDSARDTPGMNDNASGALAILEISLQLAKYSLINAVRFAFWSGGMSYHAGSDAYIYSLADEEARQIAVYLEYVMISS